LTDGCTKSQRNLRLVSTLKHFPPLTNNNIVALGSQNKAFIEVEQTGTDLEQHQEQLLNYSFQEGVKLASLTNGVAWRFYLPLHEGSGE